MDEDHDYTTCGAVECLTCLTRDRRESVVRLETALMGLEASTEGREGAWLDRRLTVDALDVRNALDLLRD
jgi:hypothetical protein